MSVIKYAEYNFASLAMVKNLFRVCHKSNKHAIFDMDVSINVQFIIEAFKISSAFRIICQHYSHNRFCVNQKNFLRTQQLMMCAVWIIVMRCNGVISTTCDDMRILYWTILTMLYALSMHSHKQLHKKKKRNRIEYIKIHFILWTRIISIIFNFNFSRNFFSRSVHLDLVLFFSLRNFMILTEGVPTLLAMLMMRFTLFILLMKRSRRHYLDKTPLEQKFGNNENSLQFHFIFFLNANGRIFFFCCCCCCRQLSLVYDVLLVR